VGERSLISIRSGRRRAGPASRQHRQCQLPGPVRRPISRSSTPSVARARCGQTAVAGVGKTRLRSRPSGCPHRPRPISHSELPTCLGVDLLLFVVAARLPARLNSVAGRWGRFSSPLPTLLFVGVNPVAANATSTLAVWPAFCPRATVAYRRDLKVHMRRLVVLGIVSVAGGWIGAVLLVRTSDTSFMRLSAVADAVCGGRRSRSAVAARASLIGACAGRQWSCSWRWCSFAIAVYGGYFRRRDGDHDVGRVLGGRNGRHPRDERPSNSLLGIVINGFSRSLCSWRLGPLCGDTVSS